MLISSVISIRSSKFSEGKHSFICFAKNSRTLLIFTASDYSKTKLGQVYLKNATRFQTYFYVKAN